MSNPWIPPYFGSWGDFINSLLHNPSLGSGAHGPLPATHAEAARHLEPNPSPWIAAGPHPEPWRAAASYVVSLLATKQVGLQLDEGRLQRQIVIGAEKSVADFIDDWCGTRPRPWPHPLPGPNPWTAALVSELSVAAHLFQAGPMKEEVLRVAGQILAKSFAQTAAVEAKLPSPEEVDAMAKFSSKDHECEALCQDFQDTLEAVPGTNGKTQRMLAARLKLLRKQMQDLHCPLCLPR